MINGDGDCDRRRRLTHSLLSWPPWTYHACEAVFGGNRKSGTQLAVPSRVCHPNSVSSAATCHSSANPRQLPADIYVISAQIRSVAARKAGSIAMGGIIRNLCGSTKLCKMAAADVLLTVIFRASQSSDQGHQVLLKMPISFKYWNECVEPQDMEELWMDPEVRKEWTDAGETEGQKVHLSRDPDGQVYLTQTEMKAVAAIVVQRHYQGQIDLDMICAIAEVGSDRQLLAERCNWKTKETRVGLMQILPTTAEWLFSWGGFPSPSLWTIDKDGHLAPNSEVLVQDMVIMSKIFYEEMGYRTYQLEEEPKLLYRPFISVYLGCAYAKWVLSSSNVQLLVGFIQQSSLVELMCLTVSWQCPRKLQTKRQRNEEFVVRAYHGGTQKATHKSTLDYWQNYLTAKESLPHKRLQRIIDNHAASPRAPGPSALVSSKAGTCVRAQTSGDSWMYWDTRVSPEDMEELWNHPNVRNEWINSGENRGKVRFSHDAENRPYLSRTEVKAVSEIIISRYFSSKEIRSELLAAMAELVSMRFVNGVDSHSGVMGIEYPTALWLHKERTRQFIVQAYLAGGPDKVSLQETGQHWTRFREALSYYGDEKK
ncbi:hypothetical protein ACLOJK_021849 [Asimina triloba]